MPSSGVCAASSLVVCLLLLWGLMYSMVYRPSSLTGGLLMRLRVNAGSIRGIQRQRRVKCPLLAEQVLRSEAASGGRSILFRQGSLWYVVTGPELTVHPDPEGSTLVQFVHASAPHIGTEEGGEQQAVLQPPAAPSLLLPPGPEEMQIRQGLVEYVDSGLDPASVRGSPPIQRFGNLVAAAHSLPPDTPAQRHVIVAGVPFIDPSYYVVALPGSQPVAMRPHTGLTVWQRSQKN